MPVRLVTASRKESARAKDVGGCCRKNCRNHGFAGFYMCWNHISEWTVNNHKIREIEHQKKDRYVVPIITIKPDGSRNEPDRIELAEAAKA